MRRTDLTYRLGTIGFSYQDWQGVFFAKGLPTQDRLSWYARQFDTLELDTTFHAIPPIDRVAVWANAVPDHFRFIAKVPKLITHEPALQDKADLLLNFAEVLQPMGHKLAYGLLQFPPTTGVEMAGQLNRLLDQVGDAMRFVMEVRHASWFNGRALPALRERGVTIVASDYQDRAQAILGPSGTVYVRLIGDHERFEKKDHEQLDVNDRLDWWLDRIEAKAAPNATVYIVASNDYAGHSPATIRRLRAKVGLPDSTPVAGSPDSLGLFG